MTEPRTENPLLTAWAGAFGLPPFGALTPGHFRPAFDQALGQHRAEIDVVLTDMMMPVMDGLALIRALRKVNPAVKIIAASGLADNETVAKAANAGVMHFLPKPYALATLLGELAELLETSEIDTRKDNQTQGGK